MEEEPFDSPNRPPPRPGAANLSSISEGRNETTIMSNTSSSGDDGPVISPAIPESYAHDPFAAEPILEHLRHLNADTASIQQLLHAADADVHLHSARIRAVLDNDPAIIQTYDPTTDEAYLERSERRRQNEDEIRRLDEECDAILRLLDVGPSRTQMTQSEVLQERLERWGRALELYVWLGGGGAADAIGAGGAGAVAEGGDGSGGGRSTALKKKGGQIDLLTLLEKLCEGCSGEEELSEALSQASQMCTALVDETSVAVRDCTEDAADAEDAYHIRLEAHSILSRRAVQSAEAVEEQFRTNGRAALKIGQQLEMAEAKRRQCESAAVLIRRWWTMENLAEQEATSGEEIRVDEEVRGAIPSSAGRMDPLYTKPENGLEAAKALKMLRTVVKQRSSTPSGALVDKQSTRRFELTSGLIERTSKALESRLLSSFSGIYTRGGTYDFSSPESAGRTGRLDWVALRELAEALTYFDNGRSLHKRYVQMVVFSRFPEFTATKNKKARGGGGNDDNEDANEEEFDMDATRSKLSSLFHRVCEVCTAEFQLIAHVFSSSAESMPLGGGTYDTLAMDAVTLRVARALLQRVISDPRSGLQARIDDILATIDRRGDFDAGAKKLDTFVIIHEKAAVLFSLLKDAAREHLLPKSVSEGDSSSAAAHNRAVSSLLQFLTTQEIALSEGHRRGYLNLELRMLHHECCANLDNIGARLSRPIQVAPDPLISAAGRAGGGPSGSGATVYQAPLMPLDKGGLKKMGFTTLLNGPLKQSVLRQPLINATDSLARARLMFGGSQSGTGGDADATARVITAVYSQMCTFYGQSYLFPIVESLGEMLNPSAPSTPPSLPFKEDSPPHDLGVDGSFWVGVERIHSAAKAFDRELWAEQRAGSVRVFEILVGTRNHTCLSQAKERRVRFFQDLEERGEAAILRALDTLSVHIQWILVAGGESMLATGGSRLLHSVTGKGSGPYAVPSGSTLDTTNSPAVKSLTYCLRAQFVHTQAALTSGSLSAFWTALSMRLYDILVARLLQHYYISTVGAVILSRDVEALRSVAMLAGRNHSHWDNLRELLTLFMTPPDSLRTILVGPEGDVNSGKGLFGRAGRDQSLVFMSRRVDYRVKTNQGMKKCQWVVDLLDDLGVYDPTDAQVNIALYSAEQSKKGS
eukprot:CAMPEP_0178490258 /NCGR_PEP_ID=MMETSP0696-20121128/10798_1 /TAXON_ID=265572 /ORGANISM="Extubocellulus spinifer, Strain CCMP396" /LENGTH=1153 /DNA_ID=CAMNT_0020118083 /DNA_START=104 /DNA_END=3565 /DNA_ORIENTATION=-